MHSKLQRTMLLGVGAIGAAAILSSGHWAQYIAVTPLWATPLRRATDTGSAVQWDKASHSPGEKQTESPREGALTKRQSAEIGELQSLIANDRGPYPDLLKELRFRAPTWLDSGPYDDISIEGGGCFRYVEGAAIGACSAESSHQLKVAQLGSGDRDGDGIPTSLDVLLGAKKTVLLASPYIETYRALSYPNGDMPRNEGVCSDVIIRALRNAGYDLQSLIQEDRKRSPGAYPGIKKPDPHIDHRRVRNLLVYFQRNFVRLPVEQTTLGATYLPGDVLFLDTLGDARPDHVGIISDRLGKSGQPLVINSWTNGYVTQEMDLLQSVPVTHRFRVAPALQGIGSSDRGLGAWLQRNRIAIPPEHRQLVVVLSPQWKSTYAKLGRYERVAQDKLRQIGEWVSVRIGAEGLAQGRGLFPLEVLSDSELPEKREGDLRSPAGLFELGTAFGQFEPKGLSWPFRRTTASDHWVDDPNSSLYNTLYSATNPDAKLPFASSEALSMYELAIVLKHNTSPVLRNAGSAHFIHTGEANRATSGCTSLSTAQLSELLRWLDEGKKPLVLQMAGHLYD